MNRVSIFGFISLILSACASEQLSYRIDPEIRYTPESSQVSPIFALEVIDSRQHQPGHNHQASKVQSVPFALGDQAVTQALKDKLAASLQNNRFRLISDPLLADTSLSIELEVLDVTLSEQTFSTQIAVNSQFLFRLSQQGEVREKRYKASRTQEVANPVKSIEVTGVVNQLLSQQLSKIFDENLNK